MSHDELKRRCAEQREKKRMSDNKSIYAMNSAYIEFCKGQYLTIGGAFNTGWMDGEKWTEDKLRAEIERLRANRWAAFSDEEVRSLFSGASISSSIRPKFYEELSLEWERRREALKEPR